KQINPAATEKQMVNVGRLSTVILMVLSAFLALAMQNAMQIFDMLLLFGAGTGLIFILRWFWWRINAWTEISAMFASGILSILLKATPFGPFLFATEGGIFPDWGEIPFVMIVTSIIWLTATFVTQPESKDVLQSFYKKIQPGGPGWAKVVDEAKASGVEIDTGEKWSVPSGIGAMLLGVVLIYSLMFSTGHWIYGKTTSAMVMSAIALASGILLIRAWRKMKDTVL
ncbi:MAG: Na+:solute symporter, partial [Bacteroidota bacterium]